MASNKTADKVDPVGPAGAEPESPGLQIGDGAQTNLGNITEEAIKPPKGAYVEDFTAEQGVGAARVDKLPAPRFADEHVGTSGRFRVDPETGERHHVYEKFLDADGKSQIRKAV